MKLTISRLTLAATAAAMALTLGACKEPEPVHVHHYHTNTVVRQEPAPRKKEFDVVNQYDEQSR
jgi:ABC-type uncharacterized transport system auxiliary subunit